MTKLEEFIQSKRTNHTTALWLGDLHLDKTSEQKRQQLLDHIHSIESDCVIISGDVSNARHLLNHLTRLASSSMPRPLYYVPGNHDYHGSSMAEIQRALALISKKVANFHFLDGTRTFPLGHGTCLIGHGGWADARAGYGQHTLIDSPDWHAIHDFRGMDQQQALRKMDELGRESAAAIRKLLPRALAQYQHVAIATHVPPFPSAVRYDDQPCGRMHLPHFSNLSLGLAILGIARAFPHRRITVLAGHAHSGYTQTIQPNLSIRVGHARTGRPSVFEVVKL
jgi:predicted phosphohydrolase